MTVGSNRNGLGQSGSTHPAIPPRDGRETLSALFDGELHGGDAARFALKRLDHDIEWRETCGRWQLIGDALRGQATASAPAHFASGVMRALDGDRDAAAAFLAACTTPSAARAAPSRARWLGGAALAASVAMAAVLAVRPWSSESEAEPAAPIMARTAPSAASSTPPRQVASAAISPTPATVPASAPASAMTPADEAANTLPRSRTVASARSAPARPTPRARPAAAASEASPIVGDPTTVMAASAPARPLFLPPDEPIVTRPWPRAALPEAGAGGLTVGFGEGPAPAASLYPFEPRPPAENASNGPGR